MGANWEDFKVVGVSFVDGYPDNIHKLKKLYDARMHEVRNAQAGNLLPQWIEVEIERTPENPHDSNAIVLSVRGIGVLGHVPAIIAKTLAPKLDQGQHWVGYVSMVLVKKGEEDKPGVKVYLHKVTRVTENDHAVKPPSHDEMKEHF